MRDNLSAYNTRDLTGLPVASIGVAACAGTAKARSLRSPMILQTAAASMLASAGVDEEPLGVFHQRAVGDDFACVAELANRVALEVCRVLEEGKFVLGFGGDHSGSIGTVKGFAEYCRRKGLRGGVIWIDAHGDYNVIGEHGSGNIHGMPLAACVGDGHPLLVNVMGGATIAKQDVLLVGANSLDQTEVDRFREDKMSVVTMKDIADYGLSKAQDAIDALRKRVDIVFVSIDTDVLDYRIGPGTPMKNENGMDENQIVALGKHISLEGEGLAPVVGMDLVEYYLPNDTKDRDTLRILMRAVATVLGRDYGAYQKHMAEEVARRLGHGKKQVPLRSLAVVAAASMLIVALCGIYQGFAPQKKPSSDSISQLHPIKDADQEIHDPITNIYWGLNRRNPHGVGLRVMEIERYWRLDAGAVPEHYKDVRQRLVAGMNPYLQDYRKIVQKTQNGFYSRAGEATEIDLYNRDQTLSLMGSQVYLALMRLPADQRGRIFTDALPAAFSKEESNEIFLQAFLQDYDKFKTDVHPVNARVIMERLRLLPVGMSS